MADEWGRTRIVWDRDLQCLVEIGKGSNRAEPEKLVAPSNLMRDIEPYKAAAADKETGLRPHIGGRAQHRDFLKRNNYIEVGNERTRRETYGPAKGEIGRDIKRALGE
jgi:hypothetical protein